MSVGARSVGVRSVGDSAGWPAPTGTTSVSDADTGAGADALTLVVSLVPTDVGAGADALTLSVRLTPTDSGSGAGGESLLVNLSKADSATGVEAESIVKMAPPRAWAFAEIYENIERAPFEFEAESFIYLNVTNDPPTPHIWYLEPAAAFRGDIVTAVGDGFGDSAMAYAGAVLFNEAFVQVTAWYRVPAGVNALSSSRSIDPAHDTVDPEHERVQFRVPDDASRSGDVQVILNE